LHLGRFRNFGRGVQVTVCAPPPTLKQKGAAGLLQPGKVAAGCCAEGWK